MLGTIMFGTIIGLYVIDLKSTYSRICTVWYTEQVFYNKLCYAFATVLVQYFTITRSTATD